MKTLVAINFFIKSRRAKGLSRPAIKWYQSAFNKFARQYQEIPGSPAAIDDFLINCASSDERRHGYYRALHALFYFLENRYKTKNVMRKIEPPRVSPKRPHILTLAELDHLLSFPHSAKVHAILLFLSDTGARLGEAVSLKIENLMCTRYGHIAQITGKTGERLVAISDTTYHALTNILPFQLSSNRMCRLVSAAFRDARVKGTAHTLRHTFGTYWEGDELTLQRILGHASISTTRRYRHLRVKRMCEQHNLYSPLKMLTASRQLQLPMPIDNEPEYIL
jgi:integrase